MVEQDEPRSISSIVSYDNLTEIGVLANYQSRTNLISDSGHMIDTDPQLSPTGNNSLNDSYIEQQSSKPQSLPECHSEETSPVLQIEETSAALSILPTVMVCNPRSIYGRTEELAMLIEQYNVFVTAISES